jgi:predicted transglutaminase-like cysteine proteinase
VLLKLFIAAITAFSLNGPDLVFEPAAGPVDNLWSVTANPSSVRVQTAALDNKQTTPNANHNFVAPQTDLGVFKSVAISAARLPAAKKWTNVRKQDFSALFSNNCEASGLEGCDTQFATITRAALKNASTLAPKQVLDLANKTVNSALRYQTDKAIWGASDYWANPVQTALKGAGDCEDFAIAKYWLLRGLGFADEQLQIVLLQDTQRQLFHAVLVAHVGNERLVLDNVNNRLSADVAYAQYLPIMSFAGGKSYIHGFAAGSTVVADMPKDLSRVHPGVGI